jgi:hypothetical protein
MTQAKLQSEWRVVCVESDGGWRWDDFYGTRTEADVAAIGALSQRLSPAVAVLDDRDRIVACMGDEASLRAGRWIGHGWGMSMHPQLHIHMWAEREQVQGGAR